MMDNTREKVMGGLAWTYAERILAQMVSTIVSIALARLILPEAYGAIAIVTIFIEFANTCVSGGFGNALIQKKDADQLDFSTVFYFSIMVSAVFYCIIFAISPLIAGYYDMDILTPVFRVMAVRLPIAAINSVQQAYISKKMEFKKFFFSTLGGTVVSAFVGLWMAFSGYGIWALVFQYLTNSIVDTIVLFCTSGWRPTIDFSFIRMKKLFSYGWKILAMSLMITLYMDLRDLIIGKKFTSAQLAYSNKGRQFPMLIVTNINTSISKVLFPVISNYQDDILKVKQATRRSIKVGTYIVAPLMIGLAAVAEPFVAIVLTERWLACVPFLRIMCIIYMLQPIQTSSLQAMKALGRSDLCLKLEVIKKIMGLIILAVTVICFNSVFAIIIGSLFAEIIAAVVNIPTNKKLLKYNYREQLEDVFPILTITLVMGLGTYLFTLIIENVWTLLSVQIIVGVLIYILLSILLKIDSYMYLKSMLVEKIKKN